MDARLTEQERAWAERVAIRKLLLKRAGYRYRDFGSPSHVCEVIHELEPNPRLRKRIARALRLSYKKAWPVAA